MFSCFLLLSTYLSIHYFVAHAGGQGPLPTRGIASSRRSLFSRVNGHSAAGGKPPSLGGCHEVTGGVREQPFFSQTAFLVGGFPQPLFCRSCRDGALPFLAKRKGSKRFASLRGLTAKGSTQRNIVKRGLRLWKQQPKQSPPFSKLSPTHQPASALQLIGLPPIRQIVPLLNEKEAT